MSNICINVPDHVYYLFIVSAGMTMFSTIVSLLNFTCPFVSNMIQNRILHRNTGLLELLVDQFYAQKNQSTEKEKV